MKKIIFLIALLAGAGAAFYGYKQWTKPHLDVTAAAEDVDIAAKDLYEQFSNNEAVANPKYLDKVIKVCGTVAENSATNAGSTTIQLETGNEMGGIMCELDDLSKQDKTAFAKGETVCFKGLCSGYLTDVVLNRCVVTK
jgi:tRNA_anti-like